MSSTHGTGHPISFSQKSIFKLLPLSKHTSSMRNPHKPKENHTSLTPIVSRKHQFKPKLV